ncbi:MAG: M28 family peptidase [Planctomycetes bacterium]|nr:M28 family peptidase [Planctomycetota bacterium]
MMRPRPLALVSFAATAIGLAAQEPAPVADRLRIAALDSDGASAALTMLCDGFGGRLVGSDAHRHAARWARDRLERFGLRAGLATREIPSGWTRGAASARIVAPFVAELPLCAAGWSPPLPPGDDGAPRTLDVLVDPAADLDPDDWQARAVLCGPGDGRAFAGAALVLVDAARPFAALATGLAASAAPDRPDAVPTAFVAHEDAELLRRAAAGGASVAVAATLDCVRGGPAEVPEVVADLRGVGPHADEVVLLIAALDSWDVGQGAVDGAAVAVLLETARLCAALELPPPRTLRFVLTAGARIGLGTEAYAARVAERIDAQIGGFVLPGGGGMVRGVGLALQRDVLPAAERWFAPLADLGVTDVGFRDGDSPLPAALRRRGVPIFELIVEAPERELLTGTRADSVDKIVDMDLRLAACATATALWALAADERPPRFAR